MTTRNIQHAGAPRRTRRSVGPVPRAETRGLTQEKLTIPESATRAAPAPYRIVLACDYDEMHPRNRSG